MSERTVDVSLDIGSSSVKALAVTDGGDVVAQLHRPIRGQLDATLILLLDDLASIVPPERCTITALTGASARQYAEALDILEVNDIVAVYRGVQRLSSSAGAILEIGGEHSKFVRLGSAPGNGRRTLRDFQVNSVCSAGTGAFLEQEAHRLDLSIDEFSEHACSARHAIKVAGRCAVFAKTDIVHRHQTGVPVEDIAYSLCQAIARHVAAELIRGRQFDVPVVFVGGVASNAGMQRALREVLQLDDGGLEVPPRHVFADALGALEVARGEAASPGRDLLCLKDLVGRRLRERNNAPRKRPSLAALTAGSPVSPRVKGKAGGRVRRGGMLGIDIGSTSTNAAYLSRDGEVQDYVTVPTRGRVLAAAHKCLGELERRCPDFEPAAVGVTGSGRELVAEMLGADLAVDEITAHAAGGVEFVPNARSILDIGGQDSKFIQLNGGGVVGFEMNKVCAAGTGSFIEEMAELLGLAIIGEFADEAKRSEAPVELGERCTVFVGSELARRLQEGCSRQDLAAGLCYAVVNNYMSRVVGRHRIGRPVVFQGGVANNEAVVAALQNVLQHEVHVHPFNEIAGAIGAALLAARNQGERLSSFRGALTIDPESIRSSYFDCQRCANQCTIHLTRSGVGKKFFSGGLCDRFDGRTAEEQQGTSVRTDLFAEREQLLSQWLQPAPDGEEAELGIPMALLQHDMLPYWSVFLNRLGVSYRLSSPTTRQTMETGAGSSHANTCLPLKVAYGHCAELIDLGSKRLLLPSVANLGSRTVNERLDHLCPVVQAWPFTAKAIFGSDVEFLTPRIRFSIPHVAAKDIVQLGRDLGASRKRTLAAHRSALEALDSFNRGLVRRGTQLLSERQDGETYAVVLGRSYTVGDPQTWLRLKQVMDEVGITPIPMDMVPDEPLHSELLHGMYWLYGKRILQTARALARLGNVPAIFLSTFGCGPDSFIVHMLRRDLGAVPLLELEVDEHSTFTGVHTRLEAFKYSLGARRSRRAAPAAPRTVRRETLRERELLIPQMSDHAHAVCAAFRSCDIDARVLPLPDAESTALGKMALGGNECLPCSLVLGDMLRHLRDRNGEQPLPAFFMISGDGPCRLGQYPWLQRAVLDDRGYRDVPIFNASQDQTFYEQFGVVPSSFKRRAWRGMVAADVLFRKWRECRCRAADRAAADVVYREGLARLSDRIERRENFAGELHGAFEQFEMLPLRKDGPKVTIGMLGENYVRCNSAANNGIADMLEVLGADVRFPSLCEWVEYTNWTAQLHCRYERQYLRLLRLMFIDRVQRLETRLVSRVARGRLENISWPSRREVFRLAAPYIPRSFEGETIVGVGRTIDMYRSGVDGVIHVSPFGCIVGGVVEALCERISDDLGGFPILTLQFDGQHSELTRNKLEGFVLRAAEWQRERENGRETVRHR